MGNVDGSHDVYLTIWLTILSETRSLKLFIFVQNDLSLNTVTFKN